MFEFLGLGRTKRTEQETPKASGARAAPKVQPKNSATQREMIRLALHDVLHRHGITSSWIGCELFPMARPQGEDALLIQLIVMKWHDGLMRYAPALQKELLDDIRRFDSSADAGKFLFAWKFAPDCGCPHDKLPDASYWTSQAGAPAAPVAPPAPRPAPKKFDLPPSPYDHRETGFAPTQAAE